MLQVGHATDTISAALVRLEQERFLDDQRFGECFAASAHQQGRYVGYRLRQEMRRRGFPDQVIASVLDPDRGLCSLDAMRATATELVEKRYSGWSAAGDEGIRQRRRAAGFLQRRGFPLAMVLDILRSDGYED